jgi:membrane protease YdiL (CAAX protease family)
LEDLLAERAFASDVSTAARPPVRAKVATGAHSTPAHSAAANRRFLHVEHLALFYLIPIILLFRDAGQHWVILMLFAVFTVGCFWWLRRDRARTLREPDGLASPRETLEPIWNNAAAWLAAPGIGARFVALGALVSLGVWLFMPERFLSFPRTAPQKWVLVMLLYPIISVVPQELIWRAFFFRRYRAIFTTPTAMILASALAFAFVHILLENVIAVALTLIGGVIFSATYQRTRSLAAVSLEHALYGCLVFTIGLGWYFFLGGYAAR